MTNMFINTRAVSNKIVGDFKNFSGIYSIIVQLIYLTFLIYSLANGQGYLGVNISLTVLSSLFTVFLVFSFLNEDFLSREYKASIKHAYRITTLFVRAVSLGITLYGIHVAVTEFNTVSLIFAVFMLFGWLCGALLEVSRLIIERYTSLMTSALSKDTEPFVKFYKRVTFKGYEGRKEYNADEEVDQITSEYKKELQDKEDAAKTIREAERLIEREQRREALRQKANAVKSKIAGFFKRDDNSDGDNDEQQL